MVISGSTNGAMKTKVLGASAIWIALAVAISCLATPIFAQTLDEIFEAIQRRNAEGSLAILGLTGIPDDAASSIFLQSGQSEREFDFRSAQLGGGFRWSDDLPLYLEGYIGYARYDPVLALKDGVTTSRIPLKWTSVAATGGVGWDFNLSEYWKFRPMAHLSIGRTQSDASVVAQAIADKLGLDRDFIDSGGIWAGGYGASSTLSYNRRKASDYQLEVQLRTNYIKYEPIGDNKDLLVSSTAANAVLWTRYRFPTGARAFNRPVRGVTDFSISYLIGDQSDVLGTDWMARVGFGVEVDVSETPVPWITTARAMVRYYGSDTVDGFTVGLGISF